MADGTVVIPPFDRFQGLRGFSNNLIAGLIQQQQQQRAAQQLQQLGLPGGLTSPIAQQAGIQQALQRQEQTGQLALAQAKPTTFKIERQLFDDPSSPTGFSVIQKNQRGEVIGQRTATRKEVLQGVPEAAITKPTTTKIEKDVIDLQGTLSELQAIEQQFDEDFFTFRGQGKAFFTALAEKAEIPTGEAAQIFLKNRTKFFADSKRVFLKFRKFITGVAGGIEEFREIAKATIDPESDSPTQFTAKLNSMRDNAIRTSNLLLAIKNSGLEPNKTNIKAAVSVTPLENIPLQVTANVNLSTLGTQMPQQRSGLTPAQQKRRELLRAKDRQ